jgi:putative Holliday junction resolvase
VNLKPRVLGLDYGEKRIGVAVTDPLYLIAQGLGYIDNKNMLHIVKELKAYLDKYQVATLVVGLPLGLEGEDTKQTKKTRAFLAQIKDKIICEIVFHDESFTSRDAHAVMIQVGMSRKKRKGKIDALAAQLMLQSYMDSYPSHTPIDRG